ncbi:MAG: galactose-1-phosphate uridylyltransferase [Candidatus Zixiibacteriota bacterium]
MSELRLNRATKEWIILATDRARRPNQFLVKSDKEKPPPYDANCPFCPGNEKQTPPEVYALRKKGSRPNQPGWRIRVVTNKYPALDPAVKMEKIAGEFFKTASGLGKHEVIIETPQHDKNFATLISKQSEEVCLVCWRRYLALEKDRRIKLIMIFRNHGVSAGTSLKHPHIQLIALPLVPANIRHLLEEAMRYYDDHGSCVFCDMMKEELEAEKRIVLENESFVAFHPFASQSPFETWIVPKKHNACFGNVTEDEVKSMALVLRGVLKTMHDKLGDPDYNLIFRTAPIKDAQEDYYHWYIQILPRLTTPAGFELGSGVYINTSLPEETAKFMRR